MLTSNGEIFKLFYLYKEYRQAFVYLYYEKGIDLTTVQDFQNIKKKKIILGLRLVHFTY